MSKRLSLVPVCFSGMTLLNASACEAVSPGITMVMFRLRGDQRHAAFMCLGTITKSEMIKAGRAQSPDDLDEDLRAKLSGIAALIRTGTTAEIVGSLHGSLPDGFSGFLDKLAPEPLSRPALYDEVFDLYQRSDPRALVLFMMEGPLTASVVNIVLGLDEAALHPEFIGALKTEQAAAALNAGLKLIRSVCSTVTDEDLRQALHKSSTHFEAAKFTERFLLRRMDSPPGARPPAEDDVFELLDHGPSLLKASRRFRNCLRTKSIHVATRKTAYAVARHKDIAFEMRPLTDGKWLVVDVLGLKNEPVSSDDWQWFLQRMRERDLSMVALPSPETREVLDHLRVFDVGMFVEPHFPTEIELDAA